MENEIMHNEEVIEEAVEAIEPEKSGKGLLIAAAVGAAVLVGRIIYKKAIKPAIEKRKAKKAEAIEADCEEAIVEDSEEDSI